MYITVISMQPKKEQANLPKESKPKQQQNGHHNGGELRCVDRIDRNQFQATARKT